MNELQLPLELLEDYSDRKHEVTARNWNGDVKRSDLPLPCAT